MPAILASAQAPNGLAGRMALRPGHIIDVGYSATLSAKSGANVLVGKTNGPILRDGLPILRDGLIDIGLSANHGVGSGQASHIVLADAAAPGPPTAPPLAIGDDPAIGNDTMSRDYLRAARADLVAGRTGEAQQSLKLAQRRALDQAALPGRTASPNTGLFIARIIDARHALETGNSHYAISLIDVALLH
jgi:hypothetical protein